MNAARDIGPDALDAVVFAEVDDIQARADAMEDLTSVLEGELEVPLSFCKASAWFCCLSAIDFESGTPDNDSLLLLNSVFVGETRPLLRRFLAMREAAISSWSLKWSWGTVNEKQQEEMRPFMFSFLISVDLSLEIPYLASPFSDVAIVGLG
jgi:hypothetical protein